MTQQAMRVCVAASKATHSTKAPDPSHDEYSDDEDPGYKRQDIRGQEAFIARELDLSDDEGSHRGPIELQSPSRHPHDPDSSSVPDSSHMAEPPGTSAYGSEVPSDQSQSTSRHEHSNQQVSLILPVSSQPGPNQLGVAEKDAGHLIQQDSYRSEHSTESSASLTLTEKSRQDPAHDQHLDSSSAQQQLQSPPLTSTSLVHQQSGFRYLLDGMLEKVSDAFGRHTPRSAAHGSDGSEGSADTLSEGGDDVRPDEQSTEIPALRTHRRWEQLSMHTALKADSCMHSHPRRSSERLLLLSIACAHVHFDTQMQCNMQAGRDLPLCVIFGFWEHVQDAASEHGQLLVYRAFG